MPAGSRYRDRVNSRHLPAGEFLAPGDPLFNPRHVEFPDGLLAMGFGFGNSLAKFRQAKGAIKLHARLDHGGQIPDFINITTGKTHEIKVARTLKIEADSISVFDCAMIDYEWLYHIDKSDAYFVTRAKDNMSYAVVRKPDIQDLP